jgi:hypothetical protein
MPAARRGEPRRFTCHLDATPGRRIVAWGLCTLDAAGGAAMSVLTPHQAAVIAQRVYGLRDQQVSDLYRRQVGGGADGGSSDLGCEDYFSVGNDSRFTARSGGAGYSAITGFGYIAPGGACSPAMCWW